MTLRKVGWSVVFVALGMFATPVPYSLAATPAAAAGSASVTTAG